jgi:hypothetical protein
MSCSCDVSLSNTGRPNCQPIQSVTKSIFVVQKYANDGTLNSVLTSATFNAAFFTARVNDADPSKRWYPITEIKNVTVTKADSIFENFDDASKIFIREGLKSFTGIIPKADPTFLGKIKGLRCAEFGVYVVDKDGNLIGSSTNTTNLYPIMVDAASWNPVLVSATDTTIQKIALNYDYSIDELDENLQMILSTEITGVNLLTVEGLLDVYSTNTAVSTSSFKAKLTTSYGSIVNKQVVKGLVAADFALYNVTTSLAVTILTATESPAGTYTFTFAAQTAGNVLRLTPTKNGFDFAAVVANTHTL